jgi:hypothetical protein
MNMKVRKNFIEIQAVNIRFNIRFFPLWRNSPTRARAASFVRFVDRTQRHTTVGITPLDE